MTPSSTPAHLLSGPPRIPIVTTEDRTVCGSTPPSATILGIADPQQGPVEFGGGIVRFVLDAVRRRRAQPREHQIARPTMKVDQVRSESGRWASA